MSTRNHSHGSGILQTDDAAFLLGVPHSEKIVHSGQPTVVPKQLPVDSYVQGEGSTLSGLEIQATQGKVLDVGPNRCLGHLFPALTSSMTKAHGIPIAVTRDRASDNCHPSARVTFTCSPFSAVVDTTTHSSNRGPAKASAKSQRAPKYTRQTTSAVACKANDTRRTSPSSRTRTDFR